MLLNFVSFMQQGAGGVAVVSLQSLSTDLGDDPMRAGASPTVSRSDASDRQPARSGRSVDSHTLQVLAMPLSFLS